jgi:hypothetical protein
MQQRLDFRTSITLQHIHWRMRLLPARPTRGPPPVSSGREPSSPGELLHYNGALEPLLRDQQAMQSEPWPRTTAEAQEHHERRARSKKGPGCAQDASKSPLSCLLRAAVSNCQQRAARIFSQSPFPSAKGIEVAGTNPVMPILTFPRARPCKLTLNKTRLATRQQSSLPFYCRLALPPLRKEGAEGQRSGFRVVNTIARTLSR